MFENWTLVLAQTDARPDGGAAPVPASNGGETQESTGANGSPNGGSEGQSLPPGGSGGGGELNWLLPMMLLFLVMMFAMTFLSQRKEKKKRAEMLGVLKKNDRIVTIGGIIGTIVEVKDTEIVVKVDESSNTRMRFNRNAIQGVVEDGETEK